MHKEAGNGLKRPMGVKKVKQEAGNFSSALSSSAPGEFVNAVKEKVAVKKSEL